MCAKPVKLSSLLFWSADVVCKHTACSFFFPPPVSSYNIFCTHKPMHTLPYVKHMHTLRTSFLYDTY